MCVLFSGRRRLALNKKVMQYMALRSMFPVKAKDMVLVTAVGRLPPTDKGLRRLIRATKSVEHPSKPAQKGYQRMELIISGFLIQDDGTGGCVMTQVTCVPLALGGPVESFQI